ncbi:IS701 family transposase [Myxococcus sp. RHSTA-1-4]|uniref:IS701 family transposase n=1 Tax=Myxococcus sp. RHSTA-1-4 TaxID=2874601 RepID=UPI001CBBBB2D|nr:IS701 family transposase [Myxococcus sp. RHSTA-1-4]
MEEAASKHEEQELVETLSGELEQVTARMKPHFRRREAHEAASSYVKALLSATERKNMWGLSEEAGRVAPYGLQHMVRRGSWDEEAVRDEVQRYARERLGEGGVLAVDETGFLKKGEKSAGVARQYTGTTGQVENCQIGVFLAYVAERGHTLLDRELYVPEHWFTQPQRCREAGLGQEVAFRTKPELARGMIERALKARLKPSWVVGDEVYGRDTKLRAFLEEQRQPYVLTVASNTPMDRGLAQVSGAQIHSTLAPREWRRLSAGQGSKGPRLYDWARVRVNSCAAPLTRWLLLRRSLTDETDVAYFLVHAPSSTSLETMAAIAGKRWPVEECFESAKGEVGLGDYEVRTYTGWYRHMTLCMVAHAFLAASRALAHEQEKKVRPKVLALPHRDRMHRFRRRQGLDSSACRSKKSDA